MTERVIRTDSGTRITLENRKGLDDASILTALLQAVEVIRGREVDGQAAA